MIGLIYSFKNSNWFSCTKIVGNLNKSYENEFKEIKRYNYTYSHHGESHTSLVREIFKDKPLKLIFTDHTPHPLPLIESLLNYDLGREYKPEFIFHIFGDFTLNFNNWLKLLNKLKGHKVKFIPFPVDEKEFFYDNSRQDELKKKLNIHDEDFVFVYTGRMSEQKRIFELLKTFSKLKLENKIDKFKLLFLGNFDDLGSPYTLEVNYLGYYFHKVWQYYSNSNLQEEVQFLGGIENKELRHYYSLADAFISIGCFHDEDYGMSVAESLCCGSKALLSDWAGFSSFKIDDNVLLLKVALLDDGQEVDSIELENSIIKLKNKGHALSDEREKSSEVYQDNFCYSKISKKLKSIIDSKVTAFTSSTGLLESASDGEKLSGLKYRDLINKEYSELYKRIYNVYY
jgi:glycosyltransferase involved in cell wall biosynthesis